MDVKSIFKYVLEDKPNRNFGLIRYEEADEQYHLNKLCEDCVNMDYDPVYVNEDLGVLIEDASPSSRFCIITDSIVKINDGVLSIKNTTSVEGRGEYKHIAFDATSEASIEVREIEKIISGYTEIGQSLNTTIEEVLTGIIPVDEVIDINGFIELLVIFNIVLFWKHKATMDNSKDIPQKEMLCYKSLLAVCADNALTDDITDCTIDIIEILYRDCDSFEVTPPSISTEGMQEILKGHYSEEVIQYACDTIQKTINIDTDIDDDCEDVEFKPINK